MSDHGTCRHAIIAALRESSPQSVGMLAMGHSLSAVRCALQRMLARQEVERSSHGWYRLGAAQDAKAARAEAEATWPMDKARSAALIRAYDMAVGRRLTGAMAHDLLVNALRFGTMPD